MAGELLICTAAEALPGTLQVVSDQWQKVDTADEQLELVQYTCERLGDLADVVRERSSESESLESDDETEGEHPFAWLGALEAEYPIEKVLPLKWGQYPIGPTHPNCLGMAIMMVALGWLCDTQVMLVSQISPIGDALDRNIGEIIGSLLDDLRLQYAEVTENLGFEGYLADCEETVRRTENLKNHVMDFHYGAAWRLRDGRWAFIDPYMHSWGVFDENREIEAHYDLLAKYTPVLPGLALVATDHGALERWCAERLQDTQQFISAAHHLLQYSQEMDVRPYNAKKFFEDWSNVMEWGVPHDIACFSARHFMLDDRDLSRYFEVMADGDLVYEERRLISKSLYGEAGEDVPEWDRRAAIQSTVISLDDLVYKKLKTEEDKEDWIQQLIAEFTHDEEFRALGLADLYLWFLTSAGHRRNRLLIELGDQGHYIHPVVELSAPAHGIALAVANHIRCWTGDGTPGYDLLDYSSSQIYWHEAVDLSPEGPGESILTHPAIRRAEGMVRELEREAGEITLLHPACRLKLNFIDSHTEATSEEGEVNGKVRRQGQDQQATGGGLVHAADR